MTNNICNTVLNFIFVNVFVSLIMYNVCLYEKYVSNIIHNNNTPFLVFVYGINICAYANNIPKKKYPKYAERQ